MKLAFSLIVLTTFAGVNLNAQSPESVPAPPAPETTIEAPVAADGAVEGDSFSASENMIPPPVILDGSPVIVETRPATQYSRRPRSRYSSQDTFFGRLMDLERRKNAWLRRTFLGR